MKLNPDLPLSDRAQARLVAQSFIRYAFDIKKVIAELRPDLGPNSTYGQKLLEEPMVRREIDFILKRSERGAEAFLSKMWDWLDDNADNKLANERRMTAARILAKGYVKEKGKDDGQTKSFAISGLDNVENLVESPARKPS